PGVCPRGPSTLRCRTGSGGGPGGADTLPQRGAEAGVDGGPVAEEVLQHDVVRDRATLPGEGVDETAPRAVVEHLAVERARLTEVVVLGVQRVRRADELAVGLPRGVHRAGLVRPGLAEGVRGVDRGGAAVLVGHRALEVVRLPLVDRLVDRECGAAVLAPLTGD